MFWYHWRGAALKNQAGHPDLVAFTCTAPEGPPSLGGGSEGDRRRRGARPPAASSQASALFRFAGQPLLLGTWRNGISWRQLERQMTMEDDDKALGKRDGAIRHLKIKSPGTILAN